jgi:hypothetical protein
MSDGSTFGNIILLLQLQWQPTACPAEAVKRGQGVGSSVGGVKGKSDFLVFFSVFVGR